MPAMGKRHLLAIGAAFFLAHGQAAWAQAAPVALPNGQFITPGFASGANFQTLDPHLPGFKHYRAGWAVRSALSPDGATLLVLTSGYNELNYPTGPMRGTADPAASTEYVFVYSVLGHDAAAPRLKQVVQVPNSFFGLAWAPDGQRFYVSGGVADAVYVFGLTGHDWVQTATYPLNHPPLSKNLTGSGALLGAFLENGLGFLSQSATSGLAVTPDGVGLVVANIYNDSITAIDAAGQLVLWEYDLRPYNNNPAQTGTPGGEAPYDVVIAPDGHGGLTVFVSSVRDREVVAAPLTTAVPAPGSARHIPLLGNANSMVLTRDGTTLFVAQDNSDTVAQIDARTWTVTREIRCCRCQARRPASIPGSRPTAWRFRPTAKPCSYRKAAPMRWR